jgi:hypothetical protein
VSRDEYFNVPKNQNSTSGMTMSKTKILVAYQESFINCENPSRNPLLESCSDSPVACEAMKVVMKTACDPEIFFEKPAMNVRMLYKVLYTGEPLRYKKSWNRNWMRLLEKL